MPHNDPSKKAPLSHLIAEGLGLIDMWCHGCYRTSDGVLRSCHHQAEMRIADLIAAGIAPSTSLSDLPLKCSRCGSRDVEVRHSMNEYYAQITAKTGWTGHSGGIGPYVPPEPEPPANAIVDEDAAAALEKGCYP